MKVLETAENELGTFLLKLEMESKNNKLKDLAHRANKKLMELRSPKPPRETRIYLEQFLQWQDEAYKKNSNHISPAYEDWEKPAENGEEEEKRRRIRERIGDERYFVIGKLGRGAWSVVLHAYDKKTGQFVAIKIADPTDRSKIREKNRKKTAEEMIIEEGKAMGLDNVVYRYLSLGKDGEPLLVMPVMGLFLSDVVDKKMSLETIVKISKDLIHGASQVQSALDKVHFDLKPDNIAIDDNGMIKINDLGLATAASLGYRTAPRDNMGYKSIRAPECFFEGYNPARSADVWSIGSLMYKMFTGRYIFEDEKEKVEDFEKFMRSLDENKEKANELIEQKLKKVPRRFRKFLKKCLAINPQERFRDCWEMEREFENVKKSLNPFSLRNPYTRYAAAALTALGIGLAAYSGQINDRIQLSKAPKVEIETRYSDLPTPIYDVNNEGWLSMDDEQKTIKKLKPLTRPFVISYFRAFGNLCKDEKRYNMFTSEHAELPIPGDATASSRVARIVEDAMIWDETLLYEYGFRKEVGVTDKLDLEDVCTIARVGGAKMFEAKKAAASPHFYKYISARKPNGEFVIPEDDQKFIKTWLAYLIPNLPGSVKTFLN